LEELELETEPSAAPSQPLFARRTQTGSILAPEAPGLLAASWVCRGCSPTDLAQLEAGMTLYDAFYRWCRDATGERPNLPNRGVA
jgi:hypothetical protein